MENRLKVKPQDTVVFPIVDGSQTDLEIQNEWDKPCMFKMKSTRPGILKMKPVFGILKPHSVTPVRLSIKSHNPTEINFTDKDRFTVVLAPLPKKLHSVALAFKERECPEVRHQAIRKVLKIKLVEDKKPKEVLGQKQVGKEEVGKKSKSEVKEEIKEDKKKTEKKSKKSRRSLMKNPTPDVNAVRESEDEDEQDSGSKSTCSTCSCNSDCGKSHAKTPRPR